VPPESRGLIQHATQLEVPVNYIELLDSAELKRPSPSYQPDLLTECHLSHRADSEILLKSPHNNFDFSVSAFDHSFSDSLYDLSDEEIDDFIEPDVSIDDSSDEVINKREPIVSLQLNTGNHSSAPDNSFAIAPAIQSKPSLKEWGASTWAEIRSKRHGIPVLFLGCSILAALLLLVLLSLRQFHHDAAVPVTGPVLLPAENESLSLSPINSSPPVIGAPSDDIKAIPSSGAKKLGGESLSKQENSPIISKKTAAVTDGKPLPNIQKNIAPVQPKKSIVGETQSSGTNMKAENAWLSKPDNFTIQIVGAHSEGNVKSLQAKLPTGHPSYIVRTIKDGKPWFALVYGSFSSKQRASVVRDSLPDEFRKSNTPWVRKQGELFSH